MIKYLEKYPILTIILTVAILLLPVLDSLEVTIMEARNFITAREMLTDGNWLLTTMNGAPRYQKPPLPTWLSAISAGIFGIKSVWAMRLPAALMVMLLGSMIYMLSRKLKITPSNSLLNSLIAVTSLYIVLIIFEAPWDIYAHTFILVAIYFTYVRLNSKSKRNLKEWVLIAVFIAASILSKGPVALYALFLPFLIAYILIYGRATLKNKWLSLLAVLLFGIVIGFLWFLYVRYKDPLAFNAIAQRETGNWTSRNVRPFYYYWSFFIQSGLWTIPAFMSLLYPYMKSRVLDVKGYKFTFFWTLSAVILLSLIPEKKSRYLMPVLIPLALNTGYYISYLKRASFSFKHRFEKLPIYFNFGILIAAISVVVIAILYIITQQTIEITVVGVVALVLSLIMAIMILYALRINNIKYTIYSAVGGFIFISIAALSVTENYVTNEAFAPPMQLDIDPTIPLYSYERAAPVLVWQAGKKITVLPEGNYSLEIPQFYLFACSNCAVPTKDTFPNYRIETTTAFDLNKLEKSSKTYKKRKAGNLILYKRIQ